MESPTAIQGSLGRIYQALELRDHPLTRLLQPELSREEIEAKTRDLPFRLPEEVCRLYQWRNGTNLNSGYSLGEMGLFNGIKHFLSLEDALSIHASMPMHPEEYSDYYPPELVDALEGATLFPLFHDGATGFYYVTCTAGPSETGLIIDDFGAGEDPRLAFQSLTEMMSVLADLYAAGVEDPCLFAEDSV